METEFPLKVFFSCCLGGGGGSICQFPAYVPQASIELNDHSSADSPFCCPSLQVPEYVLMLGLMVGSLSFVEQAHSMLEIQIRLGQS